MISDYFFMHRIIRETINKMIIIIKKEINNMALGIGNSNRESRGKALNLND